MIGLVVATFGSDDWQQRGKNAAVKAARTEEFPAVASTHHSTSLAQARNDGARLLADKGCTHAVFLDADDGLQMGYGVAMGRSVQAEPEAAIHRPATLGYYPDEDRFDEQAKLIPRRDLERANYIVIGACVDLEWFHAVGGFPDYPVLEDWACWRKIVAAGGTVSDCPEAIYIVGVNPNSRNGDSDLHREVYRQIRREVPMR